MVRKRIATACSGGFFTIGLAVAAMTWPTLDPAIGLPIIVVCAIGCIVSLAVFLWPEKESPIMIEAGPSVLSHWSGINPLQLYQAACLWVGKAPPDAPDMALPFEAGPWLHRLREAVSKKKLPIYRDKDGLKYQAMYLATARVIGAPMMKIVPKVPSDTEVGRADLAAFADSIGERPAFLFGDEQ